CIILNKTSKCINIKQINICFRNVKEFEIWRKEEQKDVNYYTWKEELKEQWHRRNVL
ncbi:hypothetical protein ILUMI_19688, partial [Ignelater luminosus]